MSVDFYPEYQDGDIERIHVMCGYSDLVVGVVCGDSPLAVRHFVESHRDECEECKLYGCTIEEITQVPRLNVHNLNGGRLLTLLGFTEMYGSFPAEDFLSRILLAKAGLRLVRDALLFQTQNEKLLELEKIARWACAHGRAVQWS